LNKLSFYFEKTIVICLAILMGIIVTASTIELAYLLTIDFIKQSDKGILIDIDDLFEVFGLFFSVLIGFELYETVRLYLEENVFHAELILLVALIAISRKVILLDYKSMEPLSIIGIAILIGTITGGYYLIKKAQK
jgi:uncharacterized membrane protein (DUF373 family)